MRSLIDGDILLYRCAAAAQKRVYICYDLVTKVWLGQFDKAVDLKEFCAGKEGIDHVWFIVPQPLNNAIHNFKTALDAIVRDSGADEYTIYLSSDVCFRDSISTTRKYKGNRDHTQRPVHYHGLKEYVIKTYGPVVVPLMEADDLMGIEQSQNQDTIICTLDKDLDQIPGLHYNWVKAVTYYVTEDAAQRNFWVQVVAGDATDNIQGVAGVGVKTAENLLWDCSTDWQFWSLVKVAYKEAYGAVRGEEMAVEMARLVHILREPLVEGKYWEPPSD